MKAVDRSIRGTNREVKELQKGLELEFDAGRFAQAQKLAQEAIQGTEMKAKALRDQMKYLEENGKDVNSEGFQQLKAELIKTENQAVLLKQKLQEIKDLKIDALAKQFEKVGGGITKAGQALTPLSAAAGGAVAALAAIGKSTITSADTLKTFADRVNLSAEELQRWQYIAMQTDVTNEELQAGLVKAQGAFGSLAKGDIDVMAQALMDLGFSSEEASKGMGANFDELVSRLAGMEDPILQAAYANEIFGERMGAKLIPMLKAGGEGLAALAAEYENFDTLTNEQISSLADFDNVMNKISYSFKVIRDQIGVALLPVMQSLSDVLNTKIIPAVQRLADWFKGLSDAQKNTLVGTLAFVAALAPALLIIGKLTSGIGGMIRMVGGLSNALSFLAAHPIIAIIGIVIALVAMLYSTNEEFKKSIDNLVSSIGTALAPILKALGNLLGSFLKTLMPLVNILAGALIPIINAFTTALIPLINLIASLFIPYLELITPILERIIGTITKVVSVIVSFLVPIITKLGDILAGIFNGIPVAIEGIVKFIEKTVNSVIDFVNKIIREINKLGDIIGFTIGELDKVSMNVNFGRIEVPEVNTDMSGVEVPGQTTSTEPVYQMPSVEDTIATSPSTVAPSVVTNNDYSQRDIEINVTVQNYADELDVDDIARQVNLKLAEAL
jgi:hypothetical protein